MERKTDLIFDFFGTLVKYIPETFHSEPYARTHDYLVKHGYSISYDDFTQAFEAAGNSLETRAKHDGNEYHMDQLAQHFFLSAFEKDAPFEIRALFVSTFIEEWSRGISHFEGLDDFLHGLAKKYRLTVLSNTNYPPLIYDNLQAMGVLRHFNHIFTSVEIGIRKPHSAIFQHTLERLDISANQAVYIGDSYEADYLGATAAGIRCILIDPSGQYPEVNDRIVALFDLDRYLSKL